MVAADELAPLVELAGTESAALLAEGLLRLPDAGDRPVPSREESGNARDASFVFDGPYCPFL